MLLSCLLNLCLMVPAAVTDQTAQRLQVHMMTDEADAVLAILSKREAGEAIAESDWQRVFNSEGYRRLKKREESIQRLFKEAGSKKFVLSQELLPRTPALRRTLSQWKLADMNVPARLALAYLPNQAHIRATIYPVIKPRTNSFVFDVQTDPAIFLYLDPEISREKFENTVAHELHHIGFGTACPSPATKKWIAQQPAPVQEAAKWIGAFGEGFAMLAAAGGADVHPHAVSKQADRERWDRDVANFTKDQQDLDLFFRKILSGELTQEKADEQAFTYFGEQGPWYTVGWKMAVTIEKAYGRQRLIETMCDRTTLFSTYNSAGGKLDASGDRLPRWSDQTIKALGISKMP